MLSALFQNSIILSATATKVAEKTHAEFSVHHFNELFLQVLIFLAIAIAIGMVTLKFKLPYTIALVMAGLFIAKFVNLPVIESGKDFLLNSNVFQIIVISIFLPALLKEAAFKIPFSELVDNKKPILALAFGGTLISFATIGFATHYLLDVPLVVAFVFASLMSATDPISVISIFKSLGVNKKLAITIEGESLFNDGIAVVLFKISSVYLLTYINMGVAGFGEAIQFFLQFAIGGLIVGAIWGLLGSWAIVPIDNYPFEITISILVAFFSYFTAEHFHTSGVIAVVVAAIIFGNYGAKIGMTEVTKMAINNVWDFIALIANSLIFLMIGLEIEHIDFTGKWHLIALAIPLVIIGRSIAVYTSLLPVKNFPKKYGHILNWGGLKGSLSIALALSLPHNFQGREDILVLTFSVVLFSLIVQGLTIKPLIQKLGILTPNDGIEEYDRTIIEIRSLEKALEVLDSRRNESLILGDAYMEIQNETKKKLNEQYEKLKELHSNYPEIKEQQKYETLKAMAYGKHKAVVELLHGDKVSEKIGNEFKKEMVDEIATLETSKGH